MGGNRRSRDMELKVRRHARDSHKNASYEQRLGNHFTRTGESREMSVQRQAAVSSLPFFLLNGYSKEKREPDRRIDTDILDTICIVRRQSYRSQEETKRDIMYVVRGQSVNSRLQKIFSSVERDGMSTRDDKSSRTTL